jgi:hypothetical protein
MASYSRFRFTPVKPLLLWRLAMSLMPLLAQMQMFRMEPEHVIAYICFTLFFLFLVWLVDTGRPDGRTYVLWGILLMMLSCGYGLIGIPTTAIVTVALQKVSFLLVLGGIAVSLLPAPETTPAKKEADHV